MTRRGVELKAPVVTRLAEDGATTLVTIPDVELVRSGTWLAAAGDGTITDEDLDAILAAAEDPEVDAIPIRIGHVDPRFDGEPALGWVERVRRVGDTLVGDLVGIPSKLAEVIPAAFRRRSVELSEVETPSGTKHKRALRGLALLGVQRPAVKGLADVLALYGELDATRPAVLLAEVSLDTVRRGAVEAVTGTAGGSGMEVDAYASELYTDHVIVERYAPDGPVYFRVDYAVDDNGDVAFGTPVEVRRTYVPVTRPGGTGATGRPAGTDGLTAAPGIDALFGEDTPLVGYTAATMAGVSTFRHTTPPVPHASQQQPETTGGPTMDEARIRELLGVAQDADVEARIAELVAAATNPDDAGNGTPGQDGGAGDGTQTAPATQPATGTPAELDENGQPRQLVGAGTVTLSEGTLTELREQAAAGAAAAAELARQRRERVLSSAVASGRIAPAERELFAAQLDKDEAGTTTLLAGLTPRFAVTELGHDAAPDATGDDKAWDAFGASIGITG